MLLTVSRPFHDRYHSSLSIFITKKQEEKIPIKREKILTQITGTFKVQTMMDNAFDFALITQKKSLTNNAM